MNVSWSALARAFESRTRRERFWVAGLATLGIPLAILFGWVEPQWRAQRTLAADVERLHKEQSALKAMASTPFDPNAQARAELQRIEAQMAETLTGLADLSRTLVAPEEMPLLLEGLLRRQPGVRLVGLRSLASEAVKPQAESTRTLALYRHGIDVELEGSWADLHGYLRSIEQLPKRLLWGELTLQADKYPKVGLKLTLYTLSTESAWMRL